MNVTRTTGALLAAITLAFGLGGLLAWPPLGPVGVGFGCVLALYVVLSRGEDDEGEP